MPANHPGVAVDLTTNVRPSTGNHGAYGDRAFKQEVAEEVQAVATHYPVVGQVTEAGTSRTLALGDAGKMVLCTSGSATAVTVPPNADVAFQLGTTVDIVQMGAGAVTPTAGAGVTIRNVAATSAQYDWLRLVKVGTNEWLQGVLA